MSAVLDSPAVSPHAAQLRQFAELQPGWDGYKAAPPTPVVVAAARDFLSATAKFPPDRVAPSVVGGIGVTYRKNGRKVYVEFRNTGSILALFSDGTTEPAVEPVDPSEYPAFVTRTRGYLGE